MNIKNIKTAAFSVLLLALVGLGMGFTGSSGSNVTVVSTGAGGPGACVDSGSPVAQCPSGTVVVGGGCDFTTGADALASAEPVISYIDQNVFCEYTCTQEGQDMPVLVAVYAVCAGTS